MLETIAGNLYDYPKYYDLVYGSDWKAEVDFLEACFERFARGAVTRVFEPACGTGRLMYGGDWPVLTLAGTYREWYQFTRRFTGAWSTAERAAFYGGNALRCYDLQVNHQAG